MAKTIKDLEKQLELVNKLAVSLGKQNDNRRDLLEELEPALAQAKDKILQLQNEVESLFSKLAESRANEEETAQSARKYGTALNDSFKVNDKLSRDYDYEKKRRISAENKAFDLETRLHQTVQSEYPASDVQPYMDGLRIDRNGKIA